MIQFKKHRRDASFFLLSTREIHELKRLCELALFLDKHHAIPATSSNFSIRASPNSFLISMSGLHKRHLNPSTFVRVNLDGKTLNPISPKPSDETLLHALVYSLFPNANVVAHSHAREFEKFKTPHHTFAGHEILKIFGYKDHFETFFVPVFTNSQNMAALAEEIKTFHKQNKELKIAFMLEGHGIYCFGSSVDEVQHYLEALLHLSA